MLRPSALSSNTLSTCEQIRIAETEIRRNFAIGSAFYPPKLNARPIPHRTLSQKRQGGGLP